MLPLSMSTMQQMPGTQQQQPVGGMSPLVKALLSQKMMPGGMQPQASPMGALAQASNPVMGALMAQRLGLVK